ncbi:uncharacterized protein LOC144563612 [Carex rostrata]
MDDGNDVSKFRLISRRKSTRLNKSSTSTTTDEPHTTPPLHREPAATPLVTQPDEPHTTPPPHREPAATSLVTQPEEPHTTPPPHREPAATPLVSQPDEPQPPSAPPFQPDPRAPCTNRKKKSAAKSSTLTNPRRSKRLNPNALHPEVSSTGPEAGGSAVPPVREPIMTEVSGTGPEAGGSAVPPFRPEVSSSSPEAGGPEKSPVRELISLEASPVRDMEDSESSPSEDEFNFGERPVWMAYHSAWLDEDEINPEEALSKKWESLDSHTGSKMWDQWVHAGQTAISGTPQPAANHTVDASENEPEEGQSSEQKLLLNDDGVRRWHNRRTLRSCPEAFTLSGLELEESAAAEGAGSKGKRKRLRKRSKEKSDVRCGRGPGKPRDPTRLKDRPELIVVGDGEFTTLPLCTKVITMIRTLTLENLPGPYRSYHTFPSRVRLAILKQFLQRYSWGKDQDIGRCLDVFEKIAAANYVSHLSETRAAYKLKYSEDKAAWKDFPHP